MRDYIFIIGPSGVGKTTLAKQLHKHYNGVYLEADMVPSFGTPSSIKNKHQWEEQVCWTNMVAQAKCFNKLGCKNIILSDIDDVRTRHIPKVFKGSNFITIKLNCSNPQQVENQLRERFSQENPDMIFCPIGCDDICQTIASRPLLPNEFAIDVANKTKQQVFEEAVKLIDKAKTLKTYNYKMPSKRLFMTWILSDEF